MFAPTSTSAISIERISKAVPASNPRERTSFDILSGFANTSLCDCAEPIDVTIPSPTRARIVSSPAPPTNCARLARTVTRAIAINCIPSAATAATRGVLITFGLTEICTASNTSRPAKSIAVACLNVKLILALSAEINARITLGTFPPARKWVSRSLGVNGIPALVAVINELTIMLGGILRRRIPISWPILTLTPEKIAVTHSPTGTKYMNVKNPTIPMKTKKISINPSIVLRNRFYNNLV